MNARPSLSVLVLIPVGNEIIELLKPLWLPAFLVLQNGDETQGMAACHEIEVWSKT